MPRKTKKGQLAEQTEADRIEAERVEDEFDKDRLFYVCKFIYFASVYRKLALSLGYGDYAFDVIHLDDGEYKFVQETTESRDTGHMYFKINAPTITSDINSIEYGVALSKLDGEISYMEAKKTEIERVEALRKSALDKLTKEERTILGV